MSKKVGQVAIAEVVLNSETGRVLWYRSCEKDQGIIYPVTPYLDARDFPVGTKVLIQKPDLDAALDDQNVE